MQGIVDRIEEDIVVIEIEGTMYNVDIELLEDEISEGDTMYLGACTKGPTAEKSLRSQPFSDIKAKQRAYSLKQSYVSEILRRYVFGTEEDEHIIFIGEVIDVIEGEKR